MRDCARRLHRARQDHHRIHAKRTARDRRTHVIVRIENIDAPRQLLHRYAALVVEYTPSAVSYDSVHLNALLTQYVNEADGIDAAACSRNADDNLFHRITVTPPM